MPRHIFLDGSENAVPFTSPNKGRNRAELLPRYREFHADRLTRLFDAVRTRAIERNEQRLALSLPTREGTYLEVAGVPGFDLTVKSLENLRQGIRLLNVRKVLVPVDQVPEPLHHALPAGQGSLSPEGATILRATVYLPRGKERFFLEKVREYAEAQTPKGAPKNRTLVDSLEDVRLAVVEGFWQDERGLLPTDGAVWCEAWLRTPPGRVNESEEARRIAHVFREMAASFGIALQEGVLFFPERLVMLIKANGGQLAELIEASDYIAEFRRAKETAAFWMDQPNEDQIAWVADILARLTVSPTTQVAVCVLDTGASQGHPLIQPFLAQQDCGAVDPAWGAHDHNGHGTLMCGLAAYGDLQAVAQSQLPIRLGHRLESIKLLPPPPQQNDPALYGFVTNQAVSRAEINAPARTRMVCMAVTSSDERDRGRPSSWSAEVDALASDATGENGDRNRRLVVISAGNVNDHHRWADYPEGNRREGVHDPGQAWNALTVGGHTDLSQITEPTLQGWQPVAPPGGLSPFSSTSATWDSRWPIKPEIVLEAGNVATNGAGEFTECDDLSLLSTCHQPQLRPFHVINATSAAAAQGAWMAAELQNEYPEAWPETIRGLLVHSAEWTPTMLQQFPNIGDRLHCCGFGIPEYRVARETMGNSLTLIAQREIQPFESAGTHQRTKEMHVHELPWPREVLLGLGEQQVSLRITLSYFVEPGPGEIGWDSRYRYASHALRFDLNSPNETLEDFRRRINRVDREKGEAPVLDAGNERWRLGKRVRNVGSIHSDIWTGSGAAMATCNLVGIYPVIGWWRERKHLGRLDRKSRYSLIVSLRTPVQNVDLYTPVAVKVGIAIPV